MIRKLILLLSIIFIFSCQNKNPSAIKSISNNDIVGDFDREKYPLIQKALELGGEKKQKEAIAKFDEAEKEYGSSVIIYLNRGVMNKELNNLNLAVQDYTKCLEINPDYYAALVNRGIVFGYLDKYKEALIDLNRAIELNSEYPIGYMNRASVFSMMNKKELACKDLATAREKDLNNNFTNGIDQQETNNCN